MVCGEAENAGGLSPAKDDNEAARRFLRRTLPIPGCVDYKIPQRAANRLHAPR